LVSGPMMDGKQLALSLALIYYHCDGQLKLNKKLIICKIDKP